MIHTSNAPGLRCVAWLLVAVASTSALAAQPKRPIDLTRLKEKDAWAAIDKAAPDDVFIVRGRRVGAAALRERAERTRAAAAERRRKLVAAVPDEPTRFVQELFRERQAHQHWVEAQQQALLAQKLAELERQHAPVSPEVRAAREEALRLAAQYHQATSADERARLKQALTDVAERLRRLGSPIETEPGCDR